MSLESSTHAHDRGDEMDSSTIAQIQDRFVGVQAIEQPSRWAMWKATWSLRHTLTAVVFLPLLVAGYAISAGSVSTPLDWTLITIEAAMGALVLASYVPERGGSWAVTFGSGMCGLMPAFWVAWSAFLAVPTMGAAPNTVASIALLGLAGVQRFTGAGSCG